MAREYTSGIVTSIDSGKDYSSLRLLDISTRTGTDISINGYVPKHLSGNFIDYHERTLNDKTYQVIQTEFLEDARSRSNTYTYRKDGTGWRARILYDTGLVQKAKQFWNKTKNAAIIKDSKELGDELTDKL